MRCREETEGGERAQRIDNAEGGSRCPERDVPRGSAEAIRQLGNSLKIGDPFCTSFRTQEIYRVTQ